MNNKQELPLVSVVILSFMRRNELKVTLKEIEMCPYPSLETIVVDNCSTDGSIDMVKQCFPWARLIALPHNIGIEGLNIGMKAAKGKYIILLDDDSHFSPCSIEKMVARFKADPKLGIAAFTIINGVTAKVDWPTPGDLHPDNSAPTFIGCGVGLRTEAVKKTGYFNSKYFLYLNELYLTARILEQGYSCYHFPDLRAIHHVSSANRSSQRRIYYATRNIVWFAREMFSPFRFAIFSLSLLAEGLMYHITHSKGKEIVAFIRGAKDGLLGNNNTRSRQPLSSPTMDKLSPYFIKWYPHSWKAIHII